MSTLRLLGQARSNTLDIEKRTVQFVISTETVDRHGTVIRMDGWKLDNYMTNPIVCYNHDHAGWNSDNDPDKIIGTCRVWIEDGKLLGEVTFETAEVNPLAEKIMQKVQAGTLRTASVGFLPHAWRWGDEERGEDDNVLYFTEQELLEWSITSVPSNPKALVRSAEDFDKFIGEQKIKSQPSPVVDPYRARADFFKLKYLNTP